ncbi:iron-molybdenum cofactor-binding protein [Ignicoccus pacificus DSM 13166]|uniref:Iron-molybdenum cofactor-binding protein n=1 Tax=Ignicoccus pacificus DSM 13166 TaxID=940294 RepID=A0A977PKQ7_9CREN|nr:iron-molybdenum cofactor-binding protein [Ignicoccus pacificus DSM 13166]
MKVAVMAESPNGPVSHRFARAPYILIYEVNGRVRLIEARQNPFVVGRAAGPGVINLLAQLGVDAVVGPQPGPSAITALQQLGIRYVPAQPGESIESALRRVI